MSKIFVDQADYDETRALAHNITVFGGDARKVGSGKLARWAIVLGFKPQPTPAASPVPYKITSGTTAAGYVVAIYANGLGVASTGTGTLVVPMLAIGSDLPAGYIGWAYPSQLATTGGSD